MKSKLVINICDEVEEPIYIVELDMQFDASIKVVVNSKDDLSKVMKNKSEIIKKYKNFIGIYEDISDEADEDRVDRLNSIKNYNDLMKTIEYVEIHPIKDIQIDDYGDSLDLVDYENFNPDEELTKFREYLFKQSYLKDKKIVVPDEFDSSNIDELNSIYEGFNILVYLKDSHVPMSMNDINNAAHFDKLCDDIKKLNLSPLEKILICYDIVRERKYNSGVDSDSFESRNIYKILNSDKIVCAGYSDIICRMFKKIDVPFFFTLLNDRERGGGHARVTVFVDDPKYDVKGLYGLDPTFDSNRKETDYLSTYNYFLKDLDFFKEVDKHYNLSQSTFALLNTCDLKDFPNYVDRIDGLTMDEYVHGNKKDVSLSDCMENHRIYSTFNKIVCLIYGKDIENKPELKAFVKEHLDEIMSCLKSPVTTSSMVKVLLNVRAIENKIDPDKYPYDINQCAHGALRSKFVHDKEAIDYSPKSCLKSLFDLGYQRSEDECVEDWTSMVVSTYNEALERALELVKDPKALSLELYKQSK
jgi:hypothetical protein